MKKFLLSLPAYILWAMFVVAVIILLGTFTPLDSLLVKPLVHDDRPTPADVIVVLGGGINKDTHSLPWGVEERVAKGVELYRDGMASKIIVSGGITHYAGEAESEVMAPYAEMLGVPAEDVIQEDRSKDTHTNAVYSAAIMQEKGWHTAIVVTSDFHTARACRIFKKVTSNIECVAAYRNPVFEGDAYRNLMDFRVIIREYGAWVYNWLRGNV